MKPIVPILLLVLLHAGSLHAQRESFGEPLGDETPNILLLFADDLGYETLGCYGGKDFQTPHLDRLAGDGMRFTRAYTSPVCTPSRMSLYTGTYAARHGYYNVLPVHLGTKKAVDFRLRFTTFPQLLRAAGYATSVTGKWQLAALEFHPQHCRDAGFDSWCVWQIWREGAKTTRYWNPCLNHDGRIRDDIGERFGPDVLADYVIDQMKSAVAAGRPFYIHHNMMLPHVPIVDTPAERSSGRAASLGGMIHYMDALCGRLIAAVDELGVGDRTYIIFMGDNGTDSRATRHTRAGAVSGGKRDLNDAGTHIPLIVRRPGTVAAGTVCQDLIDMADWFPTFCDLAGVTVPADVELDGVSFASRLSGGEASPRQWVTAGIRNERSVFDGQWRVRTGTDRIIDARKLPQETVLEPVPAEAESPVKQLRSVLAEQQRLGR
ncbi:sulfatase-like hydrolase/transferase [Roseimaritima ulvae]|uniref:Arylsulfatase n=1 Tax=Roseimaritima ulvae TaxID=980254 RepID=A0A5B9QYJ9_9BACT|nr:sulfatase-like hydrolase/transferase [Roseimaritima ulvae]QEG39061.1 Arylsulfatase [Roseimaritima ulvae]